MKRKTPQDNSDSVDIGTFVEIPIDSNPSPNLIHRPARAKSDEACKMYNKRITVRDSDRNKTVYDIYLVPNKKADAPQDQMYMSVRKVANQTTVALKRQQLGEFRSLLASKAGITVLKGAPEKFYGTMKVLVDINVLSEIDDCEKDDKWYDRFSTSKGYKVECGKVKEKVQSPQSPPNKKRKISTSNDDALEKAYQMTEAVLKVILSN